MFIDEARVHVRGGRGGNGAVAFLREKHRPKGGPAGGDGGNGGDVVFEVSREARTLIELYRRKKIAAADGKPGGGRNCSGRAGDDTTVRVPPGTVVRDASSGAVIADLTTEDERVIVAAGGRGGRGNQHFATPTDQAPRRAEPGRPGESRELIVELKLIADAGIVGLPNAGKSTLLSRVSAARPKVAAYPFTTIEPALGIVTSGDFREIVLADLPGLIEGASEGAGLGHEFLKHVERTRLIVHLVDAAPVDGTDPVANIETIRAELAGYSEELARRPEVLVANKIDVPEAEANVRRLREAYGEGVLAVSAATGAGVKELLGELFRRLVPPR
ncbi:MAG: GTPase ObgE [Planctomycetota bacterium]|jgi:GTP-binding protein